MGMNAPRPLAANLIAGRGCHVRNRLGSAFRGDED